MIIGNMLAILLIIYYIAENVIVLYLALWCRDQVLKQKKEGEKEGEKKPKELFELVNKNNVPSFMAYFSVLFDEYGIQTDYYKFMLVPVTFLKDVVFAVCLVGLEDQPVSQLVILLLIEIAYIGYAVIANVKSRIIQRIVEWTTEGLIAVYILVKLISTNDSFTDMQRQVDIGGVLLFLIYGIIVVSILFALFSLILILFQLCKRAILWYKQRKVVKPQPVSIQNAVLSSSQMPSSFQSSSGQWRNWKEIRTGKEDSTS
jgi:hypothetical protein